MYGCERAGAGKWRVENAYVRHYVTGGLELVAMALDYVAHGADPAAAAQVRGAGPKSWGMRRGPARAQGRWKGPLIERAGAPPRRPPPPGSGGPPLVSRALSPLAGSDGL